MRLIAHRGDHKECQENTLEAFKRAINNEKFCGFEFDVRMTKDRVFVINHDPIYNGKIISISNYQELSNIPTLEEVLKLKTHKIKLLEIKDYFLDYNYFLTKLDNTSNLYIMSFYNKHIKELNKLTNIKVGSLNYYLNNMHYYDYDFICLLGSSNKHYEELIKHQKEVFYYGLTIKKHHLLDDAYLIV